MLLLFALKGRLLERMSILLAMSDPCVAKAIWRSLLDTLMIKLGLDFLSYSELHWFYAICLN